jgi:hypothetical protein
MGYTIWGVIGISSVSEVFPSACDSGALSTQEGGPFVNVRATVLY